MAGDDGEPLRRQITFGELEVGPAHGAGPQAEQEFAGARLGHGELDEFQR